VNISMNNVMDKTRNALFTKFKTYSATAATTKTVNGPRPAKQHPAKGTQNQQKKVPHRSAPKKQSASTSEPFKIRLTGNKNCHHTTAVTVSDFPSTLKVGEDGIFKWFKLDIQTNEFTQIEGQSSTSFLPTVDHVGCRISCQWVPLNMDSATSNFAEFGPLICDPEIQSEVDKMIETLGLGEAPLKWELKGSASGDTISLTLDKANNLTVKTLTQVGAPAKSSSRESKEAPKSLERTVALCPTQTVVLSSGLGLQLLAPSANEPILKFNCISARARDIISMIIRSRIDKLKHVESDTQQEKTSLELVKVLISVMGSAEEKSKKTLKQIEAYEVNVKELKARHVDFQKEVVSLKSEKERLAESLEKLRKTSETDKKSIADLNKTCSKKTGQHNKLREKFNAKAKQVTALEKELRALKETHRIQTNNFKELKASHQTLETQLVDKCKDLRQLSTEVEKDSTKNAVTVEELEQLRKQVPSLQKDCKNLKSQLDDTKTKFEKNCEEVKKLREEKQKFIADTKSLRNKVNDLERNKTAQSKNKTKLEGQLEEAKSQLVKLTEEVEEKTRELTSSEKTIRSLETDQRFTEGKVRTYQHEVQTLRSDRDTDMEELRKKETNIEKLKRKIDKATTKNDKLTDELETLKEHMETLVPKTKLDRILGELEITQNTVSSNHESLKKAETQVLEYRRSENLLKLEVKELKARISGAEESRERLVGERNYFKKQAESMRVHVEKMGKCQVAVSQPDATTMSNVEILEKEEEILNLKQKVKNLMAEKDGAEEAVKSLRKALDEHIQAGEQKRWEHQLYEANTNEDYRSLITRKDQLQKLANQLYDIIADQQTQIKTHKHTCKVLGLENIDMKKKLGLMPSY